MPVAYNFTEEDTTDVEDKELIVNAGKVVENYETSKHFIQNKKLNIYLISFSCSSQR